MIDQYPPANGVLTSLIWRKTAAGSETSLSGYDNASQALSYTPGQEQVYLNGILLVRGSDYTATNGTSITGLTALAVDDFVQINCYNNFSVASLPSTSITGEILNSQITSLATTKLTGTITNAQLAGSIANDKLTNSSITINGSAVSLGGSVSLAGDIESVTATSPLTGGGTTGALTVGIQSASTSQSGAVQLSDSTSTTSSVLAATPTAVKSAYDLANGAIPKTLTTTTGDIIYASGANTPARLGIGSTGNVLTVASGVPSWAAPASGGAPKNWTLVNASGTSASGSSVTISGITKDNILIYYSNISGSNGGEYLRFRVNGDTSTSSYIQVGARFDITFGTSGYGGTSNAYDLTTNLGYMELARHYTNNGNGASIGFIEISGAKSTTSYKKIDIVSHPGYNNDAQGRQTTGFYTVTATPITSITILMSGGNMDTGTIYVYETD